MKKNVFSKHHMLQWLPSFIGLIILVQNGLLHSCATSADSYRTKEIYLGSKIPKIEVEIVRNRIEVNGALTNALVFETLSDRKHLFTYCYEDALLQNRAIQGQLAWDIQTEKRGLITGYSINADETTIHEEDFRKCVGYHLLRTKFPASIKGDSEIKLYILFSILKN